MARFIVKNYIYLFLFDLILVIFSSTYLPKLRINNSLKELVLKNASDTSVLEETIKEFGSDRLITVAIPWNIDDPADYVAIEKCIKDLKRSPYIENVSGITNFSYIKTSGNTISTGPVVPYIPPSRKEIKELKRLLSISNLLHNYIVSDDLKYTAIYITLSEQADNENRIVSVVRQIKRTLQNNFKNFYLAGAPIMIEELYFKVRHDIYIFTILPVVIVFIILLFIFRNFYFILLPNLSVWSTMIVAFAYLVLTGKNINISTSILPTLISVIGLTDVIHILNHYRGEFTLFNDKRKALLNTLERMIGPCFMTSFTTALGFSSLIFSNIQTVKELGEIAAVGVMVAYLYTITFVPSFLMIIPHSNQVSIKGVFRGILDDFLESLSFFIKKRKIVIILISALLVIFMFPFVFFLKVESSMREYFSPEDPVRVAYSIIDTHLSGSAPILITYRGDENTFKDHKILTEIDRFERFIGHYRQVRKIISLPVIIKEVNRIFHRGEPAYFKIPPNNNLIAQYLLLMEGSDFLNMTVNEEYSFARSLVMTANVNTERIDELKKGFTDYLKQRWRAKKIKVHFTGTIALIVEVADRIVKGQIESFFTAFLMIFLIIGIFFKSARVAILTILPNIFPILSGLSFMALADIPLNLTTVMVASIALGIAVDDTIHFTARYLWELRYSEEPLKSALTGIGKSMIFTTVVVSVGFIITVLSALKPLRHFGLLTTHVIFVALLTDLVLTPAILEKFYGDAPNFSKKFHKNF